MVQKLGQFFQTGVIGCTTKSKMSVLTSQPNVNSDQLNLTASALTSQIVDMFVCFVCLLTFRSRFMASGFRNRAVKHSPMTRRLIPKKNASYFGYMREKCIG